MVLCQGSDGGDDLQVWRVAVSIMNKRSRTVGKEWSSESKLASYKISQRPLVFGLDGFISTASPRVC
jgi:hypothetical protein